MKEIQILRRSKGRKVERYGVSAASRGFASSLHLRRPPSGIAEAQYRGTSDELCLVKSCRIVGSLHRKHHHGTGGSGGVFVMVPSFLWGDVFTLIFEILSIIFQKLISTSYTIPHKFSHFVFAYSVASYAFEI